MKALLDRRLLLALGAALLVGGWGTTRYAHEQQMIVPASGARTSFWVHRREVGDRYLWPSNSIYALGVTLAAVGAGLIGFAVLPKR